MNAAGGFLLIGAAIVGLFVVAGKGVSSAQAAQSAVTTTVGGGGSASLGSAGSKLNANQRTFASQLAADTGLDPRVVAAWVLSEEPASASNAPNGANNWLNIGSTDSGFYGAGNPAWGDPARAADFTASWIRGTADPGFGSASAGIRGILSTVGQDAHSQILAIQHSGWASSGYPGLESVYMALAG